MKHHLRARRPHRRQFLGLVAAALAWPLQAPAQGLDQLRVYYGFPPGSAGDITSRRVTERFVAAGYVKTPGVVENKAGTGGRLALEALKSSSADGSVLAVTPMSPLAIYPHVIRKFAYDPWADFAPVSIAAVGHHALAVGPMVPDNVRTLKSFLAWAKANPEQAAYGSPEAGSTLHLLGAWLGLLADVALNHVPYRGTAPGVTDTVGGRCPAGSRRSVTCSSTSAAGGCASSRPPGRIAARSARTCRASRSRAMPN